MIGITPAVLSFAEKPTITGERVLLRPVDPADAAGLAVLDGEALRLTGTQRTASLEELQHWYATRASHTDRLGTGVSRLALAHAFETVGVHRVELQVYAFNPRAWHVYGKLGFSYEGTRRQALCWDGQWIDSLVMAMLASEWQAGRGAREV
jgi:hypothetical protein